MQTFLPQPNFSLSAKLLDSKRLGKQRVEAYQILKTLSGLSDGWKNHPAVKMWRGYENALRAYMNAMISEWICRGYKNTMLLADVPDKYQEPVWLGRESFHYSHRCNLVRKDPEFYGKIWPDSDPSVPYEWPI